MRDWPEQVRAWRPPETWDRMLVVDAHTEGEPLRVILGFPELEGNTIPALRRDARTRFDALRRALMWEPRGHADMYGCIVLEPVTEDADVGVLFTHNAGFSTMCGHGVIGVAAVLVEMGLVEQGAEETHLGIDTPAGLVRARVHGSRRNGTRVSFVNVPSYVVGMDRRVEVPGLGLVTYDLAFGGAYYAYVDADSVGLSLEPSSYGRIIEAGRAVKAAVAEADPPKHPTEADLGFLYGTIFVGPASGPAHHSRNVCVFADGEVDRSPTGTGVSGRLALHHARGELGEGEEIVVESILGTTFSGRIVGTAEVGGEPAVVPEVTGRAWISGRNEILVDPADPLARGFLLR